MRRSWGGRVLLLILAGTLAGCGSSANGPAACDNAGLMAAQHARESGAEVTFCGTVVRLRGPRRTRSGVHRYIYVDAGGGDVIEIDANLDVMGDFPVATGERAVVHGTFYDDPGGREGVDWTHRTDRGPHPPGYLTLDGTTYR